MQEKKDAKIMIPEGCFEGNCYSCCFAKKDNMDAEGRVFCKGEPGGYNFPFEKDGCRYYMSKIRKWLTIILAIWFIGGVLELLVSILTH